MEDLYKNLIQYFGDFVDLNHYEIEKQKDILVFSQILMKSPVSDEKFLISFSGVHTQGESRIYKSRNSLLVLDEADLLYLVKKNVNHKPSGSYGRVLFKKKQMFQKEMPNLYRTATLSSFSLLSFMAPYQVKDRGFLSHIKNLKREYQNAVEDFYFLSYGEKLSANPQEKLDQIRTMFVEKDISEIELWEEEEPTQKEWEGFQKYF